MRIAIIGVGHIADRYARNLSEAGFTIACCFDTADGRADAFARQWNAKALTRLTDVAGQDVNLALNLTPARQHAPVSLTLLACGVPVYSEKPLAHDVVTAIELVRASDDSGVALACAPDTMLSAPQQQLRRAVDAGVIGRPLLITAQMAWSGHEQWHPRPEQFFQRGGGPLLDIGPYWVTTMVNLVGRVNQVTALQSRLTVARQRSVGGRTVRFDAEVPTTAAMLMEFDSGVLASLVLTFDAPVTGGPSLEVVGEDGALMYSRPLFDYTGVVLHRPAGSADWTTLSTPAQTGRLGLGVQEVLAAHRGGTVSRLDKGLAMHVLEVLEAASVSGATGSTVRIRSSCERPEPMPSRHARSPLRPMRIARMLRSKRSAAG